MKQTHYTKAELLNIIELQQITIERLEMNVEHVPTLMELNAGYCLECNAPTKENCKFH